MRYKSTLPSLRNFVTFFSRTYKKISSIDPRIIEREIKTYENVKHVQQKIQIVNPIKAVAINV
jgi:hypothetical protein